jgi:hypothetical protein
MARGELEYTIQNAQEILNSLKDGDELEAWVQSKITKAADYISSVYHYMEYEKMAAGQVESGPRDFEESIQNEVKNSLKEQWLNRKNQGN